MPSFDQLCDELVLLILTYLDVSELLAISRTSYRMRALACDPLLHSYRLHLASARLSHSLQSRPPLSSLLPPSSSIYLSRTHVLARSLSRKLIKVRLARNLSRRPSATSLVHHNILPEECYKCNKATGQIIWGVGVAPRILDAKRRVERERVKDGLRGWLEQTAVREVRERERMSRDGKERLSVRALVRRFTSKDKAKTPSKWGGASMLEEQEKRVEKPEEPARAKVLGLRKFWEGLAGRRVAAVGA